MVLQQSEPVADGGRIVTCANCGEDFAVHPKAYRAKFCSGRCRKAQYGRPCADCGRPTSGSEGAGLDAPQRCRECGRRLAGAKARVRLQEEAKPRRERLAARWREGASLREIADEFEIAVGTVAYHLSTLRSAGWDIPVRHVYPHHRSALSEKEAER